MKKARVRTESMVQRYAKKPISEGFELWDRGYLLGALRLFMFKSESALPFQLAPCIDAMGEITLAMDGTDDAKEQFRLAADKYSLLQQPVLAELMRVKLAEVEQGTTAALDELQQLLAREDPEGNGGGSTSDAKRKSALARCYAYLSELLLLASPEGEEAQAAPKAVEAALLAVDLGWDRVHTGYRALGDANDAAGDLVKARQAYHNATSHCPHYLEGLEREVDVVRRMEKSHQGADKTEALDLLNRAIELHPRAVFIREKAFLLSELSGDAEALAYLDPLIEKPPPEEAESVDCAGGATVSTLLKAKAAILADGGKLGEALEVAQKAATNDPEDDEAAAMISDIKATMV